MEACRILFLAANPTETTRLALDHEVREIEEKIQRSEHRDQLQLITKWAVRPDDLMQCLNQYRPQIVHFSGHGSQMHEILLMDDDSAVQPVSCAALGELFRVMHDKVRLVVLNACFSHGQAAAIVQHVDCAIGMNQEVGDAAAVAFAASFYRALGFGHSVASAFEQGKAALMINGIPEEHTPQLLVRAGADAQQIVLIEKVQETSATTTSAETGSNDRRQPSISIGGNVTGSAIVSGSGNQTNVTFTHVSGPPPESVDIRAVVAQLRQVLESLDAPDQKKVNRALEDVQDEVDKADSDRDEIGTALRRALRYARDATAFGHAAGQLQPLVAQAAAWLGASWQSLLNELR